MKNISGLLTALITPFKQNTVDYDSLKKLLLHQLAGGVDGFVVNGTTAESPTLHDDEVEKIFRFCRSIVPAQMPLILGTGSNSTEKTLENTKRAAALGADAALVVVPYYNKPPQRGLFEHFSLVANQGGLPVILYNVPGRTVTALELETIVELSKNKNIIGIKEASGKMALASAIRSHCCKDFILLSGDDGTYVDFLEAGGDGIISVASHLIPAQMKRWRDLVKDGEGAKAKEEQIRWNVLIELLFIEANPIPVKKGAQLLGIIAEAAMRLPLVELADDYTQKLKGEMIRQGLLQ